MSGRRFLPNKTILPFSKKIVMPDWFKEVASTGTDVSLQAIAVRLVVSAILGLVVGAVYHGSQRKPIGESFSFVVTMILLTIMVSMTTLVIGKSVARAFSLVGALSIVRFRTVVDDARDTAFVIFAVVVGMAVGAGIVEVYLVGVPVVAVVSIGMSIVGAWLHTTGTERRLEVRVEVGLDPEILLAEIFRQQLVSYRLAAASTAKQGTSAGSCEYAVRLCLGPQFQRSNCNSSNRSLNWTACRAST